MTSVQFQYDVEKDLITIDGFQYQGFLFPTLREIIKRQLNLVDQ